MSFLTGVVLVQYKFYTNCAIDLIFAVILVLYWLGTYEKNSSIKFIELSKSWGFTKRDFEKLKKNSE